MAFLYEVAREQAKECNNFGETEEVVYFDIY